LRVVIGLGANLGDRLATLREAAARIGRVATVLARSQVYETVPVGGAAQPDFLNAAVLVDYTGSPHALLDETQRIEAELGRDRSRELRWGPRTIDLDVLWIDGVTVDDARLVVPHPRLTERAFALLPLLDVAASAPFAAPPSPAGVRATGERL
jgi:2-amino-4-hydroxy-6-hydroxymethyldihydropteridine diphosphokinase